MATLVLFAPIGVPIATGRAVAVGALTALGMLSGLFTANVAMPAGFTTLSKFTPQGWALNAWKLTLAGQPAGELLLPCAVLLVMGAVMFVIDARLFNRRFA